jgi:hypothetical protein
MMPVETPMQISISSLSSPPMEAKPYSIKPNKTTAKDRHVTVNPIAAVKDVRAYGGLDGVEGQLTGKVPQKQARIVRAAHFCLKG